MTAHEPQDEQALLARYRRASAADGTRPRESTRAAILAEAARVAAAPPRPAALKPFDYRGAAKPGRTRFAAYGTLGAALLAGVLMIPLYHRSPPPSATPSPVVSSPITVPLTGERGADAVPSAPAAAAPADQARANRRKALQEDVIATGQEAPQVTASQRPPPPSKMTRAPPVTPTALLQAVSQGDLAQTTRLLEQGASVRATDAAGRSALLLAVMQGRADLVVTLLEHGADPAAADRAGRTPLGWAQQHHDDELVGLLSAPPPH